ncbi:MAG: PAS domain S-box protein [Firmicutes bacterium]|nr:PAS domain S-box protein [Bacillota bacterium]
MKGKQKYLLLLKKLPYAFAYHHMLTASDGKPVDYLFLDINPAFETLTGLKRDRVVGKKFTDLFPEIVKSFPDWIERYGKVAAGYGDIRFEQYFESAGRWYEVTAYSNAPGYFATVYHDITENRRFQNALRESEESLSTTLHSIGDGVIATNLEGEITRMNPQAEKLTGWTFREAKGKHLDQVFRIINAKTGKPAFNPVEHVIKTGKVTGMANDTALINRSGELYQIEDSAAPIHDSKGKISGVVMVFSDVTEKYHARKTLEETTRRLKHVLRATRTGIDVIDKDFNLHYVDSLWQEIYGPPEGRKCYEYFKDLKEPCPNCGAPRALKTKRVAFSEQTLPKEDNRVIECHAVPFQREDGEWMVAQCKTDVTHRKQLEERLKVQLQFEKLIRHIGASLVDVEIENIDKIITQSLQKVGTFFKVDRGVIFQVPAPGQAMVVTHEWSTEGTAPLIDILLEFSAERFPWLFERFKKREVIHIPDVNLFPAKAGAERDAFSRQGMRSLLIMPFTAKTGDYTDGFLAFDSIRERIHWTEEQVQLLTIFAEVINSALTRRQVEIERKKTVDMLKKSESRYRSIVENINDALIIHDLGGNIIDLNDSACRLLGYERGELLGANLALIQGSEDQKLLFQRQQQLLKNNQLLFEGTYRHRDGSSIPCEISSRVVSHEGRGLVQAFARDITYRKQQEQQIASYTTELENLYLTLEREMNKAKEVHERTLPKRLPKVQGLSFAAHYQPAERLSGDFYDVVQVGKRLVIYLSDVTGHGVDGAMLSVFVKQTIKGYLTFSPEKEIRPGKIVGHLARQFQEENLSAEYFICIFLAVLDLETRELTYTAAGFQDTPLVRLGSGERLALKSKGLFLSSAFSNELLNLQEGSLELTPGTTIFFNTDGLSEQGVRDNFYGNRLPAVFYENCHLSPRLIADIVREDFRRFNDNSLQGHDDITFLVMQVDPNPHRFKQLELASDFSELDRLRERIFHLLEGYKERDLFLSCLHELTCNAMEHGNRLEREKKVLIELVITDHYIQGSVEDQGEGFNWRKHINKPLELEGLSERGRGIAMVRICSKQLLYNDQGNRATFIVKN